MADSTASRSVTDRATIFAFPVYNEIALGNNPQ